MKVIAIVLLGLAAAAGPDEFPRLEYDGVETLNDRCPVRRVKLNPKMRPVFVNGRPIGFC